MLLKDCMIRDKFDKHLGFGQGATERCLMQRARAAQDKEAHT